MKRIPLTRGMAALVDDQDYEFLSSFSWFADPYRYTTYARRNSRLARRVRIIGMHRYIMLPDPDQQVDHINGNGLDNRRCNLRLATRAQNNANQRLSSINSSGFKGVSFHKQNGSGWCAYIKTNGHRRRLGMYPTPEEAARAYDRAAIAVFGEFARLNFSDDVAS